MRSKKTTAGFSILEVLLVLIMIALLATFGLSDCSGKIAKTRTAHTDMSTIQAAFRRCYADCKLTDDDLQLFARFGLWPLFQNTVSEIEGALHDPDDPGGLTHDDLELFSQLFEKKLNENWKGPYLDSNATQVFSISPINAGQDTNLNEDTPLDTRRLPVRTDTWSSTYDPETRKTKGISYYRIIIPAAPDGTSQPHLISLVCTGPNKRLDTQSTDIDPETHELVAQGDDIVLRLLSRTK